MKNENIGQPKYGIIENLNKLEEYLINESKISLIDIQKISTYLTNIREEAINYTPCDEQFAITDVVVPKDMLREPHGCLDYSQGYDRCEKQCKRCKDL